MSERYNFYNLIELFGTMIPRITPDHYALCDKDNSLLHDINLTSDDIRGFLIPKVNCVKNEFGIFGANGYSKRGRGYLKSELKKYYLARNNMGGYYNLFINYYDTPYIESAYSSINNTEILMVRFLNNDPSLGERKYKFTITYNEGEEYICVACRMDSTEFSLNINDDSFEVNAAADTIFTAHLLSIILLLLRPKKCSLDMFKDNIYFNLNVFENSSDKILEYISNYKESGPSESHGEIFSFVVGQEDNKQLTYYSQDDSFMFIATFTNNTESSTNPIDIFTNISDKINAGRTNNL